MSDNFGLKLGIEGEKDFKNALKDINSTFKVLGSELNLVSSQFDKQDKSVEAVSARSKVLNREIDEQKKKIALLKDALENASESFGENDKRTKSWQTQLNNAQAELNKLEKELKDNESALDDTGDEFKEAEKKADKFGDELKDTANDAEKSEGKFKKVGTAVASIGKAMGVALAAIGTATIAAGKKLVSLTQETANVGDGIDKMSQKLGLSAESYQKWDYVLSQSGVEITSMTTGLKTLTNQIDDAKNGSANAQARFAKLGISMSDLKTMSREDIFAATMTGFQKMSDSTERAALANDLFGKSGQNLTPLFNESVESTQQLMQAAEDLGFVMSDKAVKASAAYNDSLDTLKKTFSGVKNNIVGELLPGFTSIMYGLSDLLAGNEKAKDEIQSGAKEITSSLNNIMPKVVDILLTLIGAVAEIAPAIIDALVTGIADNMSSIVSSASSIALSFLSSLIAVCPQLTEGALSLVKSLADGLSANAPLIIDSALQMVVTLAQGLASAAPTLIPQIVQTVILVAETLLSNLDILVSAAVELCLGLGRGIAEALPMLIAEIPRLLSMAVSELISSLSILIPAAYDIIFTLADGILSALPELIAIVPNLIIGLISGLTENLPQILLFAPQILISLATGLLQAIPDLLLVIPRIIISLVDSFKSYDWSSIGKNIMSGLRDGVSGMINKIKEKFREVVNAIKDTFKRLFGINSPSTVFAGFGKNLLQGLWNGIANIKDWLIGKIRGLGSAITSALKAVFGINSPSKVFENEIGKNLGLGLGVGFEKAMETVKDDMAKAVPTDFDISANVKSAVNTTGVTSGFALYLNIDNFYNNSLQDIRQLAEELSTAIAGQVNRKAQAF